MISIITPVYNPGRYIDTMIQSVLDQTYEDFELVLVDDKSTDDTIERIKKYDDKRIKLIQLEQHSGFPGSVRNRGIEAATGTWLYFIDHDDAIMPDMLQTLADTIEDTKRSIIYMCDWYSAKDNDFTDIDVDKVKLSTDPNPVSDNVVERINYELCNHGMHSVPWLYCIKKDTGLMFPENTLAEDVCMHLKILKMFKVKKIAGPHYIYRTNQNSLTSKKQSFFEGLRAISHFHQFCKDLFSDNKEYSVLADFITYTVARGISTIYLLPYVMQNDVTDVEINDEVDRFLEQDPNKGEVFVHGYLHEQINSMKLSNLIHAFIEEQEQEQSEETFNIPDTGEDYIHIGEDYTETGDDFVRIYESK